MELQEGNIKELKRKMEEIKEAKIRKGKGVEEGERLEKKLEKIEKRVERRDRKERKNNIVARGTKVGEEKIEEAVVREVLREIEVITDIEKVRKIGEKDKEGRGVVMVSYGEKKRLRDKRERRDDTI